MFENKSSDESNQCLPFDLVPGSLADYLIVWNTWLWLVKTLHQRQSGPIQIDRDFILLFTILDVISFNSSQCLEPYDSDTKIPDFFFLNIRETMFQLTQSGSSWIESQAPEHYTHWLSKKDILCQCQIIFPFSATTKQHYEQSQVNRFEELSTQLKQHKSGKAHHWGGKLGTTLLSSQNSWSTPAEWPLAAIQPVCIDGQGKTKPNCNGAEIEQTKIYCKSGIKAAPHPSLQSKKLVVQRGGNPHHWILIQITCMLNHQPTLHYSFQTKQHQIYNSGHETINLVLRYYLHLPQPQ